MLAETDSLLVMLGVAVTELVTDSDEVMEMDGVMLEVGVSDGVTDSLLVTLGVGVSVVDVL